MSNVPDHVMIPMSEPTESGFHTKKASASSIKKMSGGSTLSFNNICYKVKLKTGFMCCPKTVDKNILVDVSGIMKPGLNAILGPTGCGKSSLLDALAARKDPHGLSGEVLIDGAQQPPNFKCISGYVVQDDIVMGTLTVRENLQFSAALRLPRSIRQKEKEERIDQIINELGLTKVAHSKVGTAFLRGVSGGERKRTSIGMELITDPSILFLDEPTTGLDASTSNAVLLLLKRLSRRGKTIIFSIHQPRYSIFKLFDSLTLLASGKLMYHGTSEKALPYFTSIGYVCESYNNPADFFLDIINGDSTAVALNNNLEDWNCILMPQKQETAVVEHLSEQYNGTTFFQETKAKLEKMSTGKKVKTNIFTRQITYSTPFFHQLTWVSKRALKNLLRNPEASVAQVIVTAFLALLVGAVFFGVKNDLPSGVQNRVGALFFVSVHLCFNSIPVVELFIVEKKMYMHEYTSGYYSVSAYFFSKLLSDVIPMQILSGIIYSVTIYFMIGFKATAGSFLIMMLTLIMVALTSASAGLAIGTGQEFVDLANLQITMSFILMLIFSGLLVNLTTVKAWLNWLKYFSIPRYGLTALQVNEFPGLIFCNSIANNSSAGKPCSFCWCKTGEEHLTEQGIEVTEWALWQNHVALACMMAIFLTISYIKLLLMKKFT
ncbi:broad substrate specificity ATP-binding cassette transporter ABCG2-like isoform X2 [Ambystoma mexicanum]|uniref:broad substrate specificity ATP-binding cassette transporter ABCG2-like isoform X2 n=1 Tax=Ambystoma mexicanum TaxID=8296 RepID=UPI0037E8B9F3